jgi:hypothetical protein
MFIRQKVGRARACGNQQTQHDSPGDKLPHMHLTMIRRKFVSPISAVSRGMFRIKGMHGSTFYLRLRVRGS